MSSDILKVYDADNTAEAELIREALAENDIEAYIDNIPSPLDGLTSMGQGTPIFVKREDYDRAQAIIDEYMVDEEDDEQ